MESCPDCAAVKRRLAGADGYTLRDIGASVQAMKDFLRLRDSHPAFARVKAAGAIGVPCFVTDTGEVSFPAEEAATGATDSASAPSCRLGGGC